MDSERDFKGVWIPKEIWLSKELTLLEKAILVEIDSLDNENHCTASNEYFAEFCDCSESKVSKAIRKLQDLEMIEVISFDGRHRKIRVVKNAMQSSKKCYADKQKVRPNNIDNKPTNKENSIIINNNTTVEFLGSGKQNPKTSLYSKATALIDNFTDDKKVRRALKAFLDLQLEIYKGNGKVFYINTWKNRLNKLANDFSKADWLDVINYAIDKGWQNFYPIPTKSGGNIKNGKAWEEKVVSVSITEEEREAEEREADRLEAMGIKARF